MAASSFEAGYPNNGIAETSSLLEIQPEIEAGEATMDLNEFCALEKKECDDIIEHLKNNPRLVVKSLGQEGKIVLHVAVMADEIKKVKKQKSLASKSTEKGFSEAATDSKWYLALERQDCKVLMSLLQESPCLVAQTGPEGRTVMHVASERGCLNLLNQSYALFKNNKPSFGVDLFDFLNAKCGQSEATIQDMAWFILRRDFWSFQHPNQLTSTGPFLISCNNITSETIRNRDLLMNYKLREVMERETSREAFKLLEGDDDACKLVEEDDEDHVEWLEKGYQFNLNYNFVLERKEFKFHYVCEVMSTNQFKVEHLNRNLSYALEVYTKKQSYDMLYGSNFLEHPYKYAKTVIDGCLELGPPDSIEVLTYLFQLHNAQGQTPIHVAFKYGIIELFFQLIKDFPEDLYKECVNAKDVRGWTILHYFAATQNHCALKRLLMEKYVDKEARTDDQSRSDVQSNIEEAGMTALHVAILHNDSKSVKILLECGVIANALLFRSIVYGYESREASDDYEELRKKSTWTPLQLAAIMGLPDIVRLLLDLKKGKVMFYDDEMLQNNNNVGENFQNVSPLLLACASGNPDTLRLFLDDERFDPLVKSKETGATALHYATNAMIPRTKDKEEFSYYNIDSILYISDLGKLDQLTSCRYKEMLKDRKLTSTSYLGKKACVTMLLQAGVDIWEKDDHKRLAEPGPQGSRDSLLWWHEQMAQETLEAKRSINDAANAISVVAALVATASFVGPLQPPLGYGDSIGSGVQDTHLSIRVFMVSNILSFYFAVASIMFAVVPSLPMPQEGIYAELQRTRRSVSVAMFFLLMSVLGVLISFGSSSNLVVSEEYSWQHAGLSFYPTLLGGLICILGIILFFIKLLRLVFHRNTTIIFLYTKFVKF